MTTAKTNLLATLRWPLIGVAACVLLGTLGGSVWLASQKFTRLIDLGWADYLGQPQGNVPRFAVACLRDATCRPALEQAWQQVQSGVPWLLLTGLFCASAVGAAVATAVGRRPGLQKPPGGARWATRADLRPLLKGERQSPQRGYLGVHPAGRMLRLPERLRCAHTLLVGGTGAGKSTGYYKPNLLMDALDGCSAVVFDLKYPDPRSGFFELAPVFAQAGHDVQLFLPYDEYTLRLPLLLGAKESTTAAEITDILAPLQDRGGDGGFFSKQQRALLTGLIMGFARRGDYDLGAIVRLLLSGAMEVAAYVRSHADPEIRDRLGGLFDQDARIRHGVVRGLVEELELFTDPRLARATAASQNSRENIDLAAVGTRSTLLYLGLPQDELMRTRGQVLLQLIKRTLDTALIRTANDHGGQLPVHTSVYLDEFAALGRLPNTGDNFATMRSRRVAYHVSLQNRAQGEAVYGDTAFHSFVSGNVRQILIFPRYLAYEDASYFSEAMGELTAVALSKGTTRKHLFDRPQRHQRRQEVGRPLLSVEEMRDWPEGEGVLLQGGTPPVKVCLPRPDERRLLGVRNPLHGMYRRLAPREVEVGSLVRDLLTQRMGDTADRSAHQRLAALTSRYVSALGSSLAPAAPHDTDQIEARTSDIAVAHDKQAAPHRALRWWLDAVLKREVPVTAKPKPHRRHEVAELIVPRASLPADLRDPEQLDAWCEQGFIERSRSDVTVTSEGLKLLDAGRIKQLKVLTERRGKAQEKTKQRVRVRRKLTPFRKDQSYAVLHRWIEANGRRLEGHPAYEALSDEAKATVQILGRYQPRVVRLPNETLRQFLGEVPNELKNVRVNNRQGVEIPVSQLERFPKLAAWCRNNVHRLVGHPKYEATDASIEPVGGYREEALALPRSEFKHLLGAVPPKARARQLVMGAGTQRARRRLTELTFPSEDGGLP